MKFTPLNKNDIQKYFQGSFLKLKEFGDKLFYVRSVDCFEVRGITDDNREFRLYLSEEHPYEVDYILPHKSFFQVGKFACMLQRVPARQYHRGITPSNTVVYHLDENGSKQGINVTFDILKAFTNKQKFFTLSEALLSQNESCVLTKRMMFIPKSKKIYVDFTPIAQVLSNGKIEMIKKLFSDEVKDFLKGSMDQPAFSIVED